MSINEEVCGVARIMRVSPEDEVHENGGKLEEDFDLI